MSSAHFNLYRLLKVLGYEVHLVTYRDKVKTQDDKDIVRFGSNHFYDYMINTVLYVYLKLLGSKKMAYQLADILTSAPGAIKAGRYLKSWQPTHVIIPDRSGPGLFIGKHGWQLFLVSHHNPARFVGNPLIGDFCPIDVQKAVSLEQYVLNEIDGVICPSEYMVETFKHTFRYSGPITRIPNLVDANLIDSIEGEDLLARLELPPGAPIIFVPSAGSRLKGSRYVYEIIRKLTTLYDGQIGFYLSGEINAELQDELQNVTGNVRLWMPGHVPYKNNIAYVKGCSFGVSPTLIENFSMAILEAHHCGLPMVVFDVGGNREMIEDGKNGYLVPYLDVNGLVNKASLMFDPDRLNDLRRQTITSTRLKYQANQIVNQLLRFVGL